MILRIYTFLLLVFFYVCIHMCKSTLDESITFAGYRQSPPGELTSFLHRVLFLNKSVALSQYYQMQMISTFIHFPDFEGKSEVNMSLDPHSMHMGHSGSHDHNPINEQMSAIAKSFIRSHDSQFFDLPRYFKYAELALEQNPDNIMVQEWLMHLVQNRKMVKESCEVFKKIYQLQPSWIYAYQIGWLNMYCLKDTQEAEHWFLQAKSFKDAPIRVTHMLNSLHYIDRHYEEGIRAITEQIQKTTDASNARKLNQRLEWLKKLDFLSKAVVAYKNHFNKYPDSLNDLVTQKIIDQIPEDHLGNGFEWNSNLKEVDSINNPYSLVKDDYFKDIAIPSHFHHDHHH